MSIIPLVLQGDPILETKSRKVLCFDSLMRQFLDDMRETMLEAGGVGLAANQVGDPRRILIVRAQPKALALINPSLEYHGEPTLMKEACLSVPGKFGLVLRYPAVTLRAKDEHGKYIRIEQDGFYAQVLQHEVDHLRGILYPSKAEKMMSSEEAFAEAEREAAAEAAKREALAVSLAEANEQRRAENVVEQRQDDDIASA